MGQGKRNRSKHSLMILFMSALGILLTVRLFDLTVIEGEKWKGYADDASMRAVYETAPRGDILDRKGRLIAGSKAVYSVNISRVDITSEKALTAASAVLEILHQRGENIQVTQEDVRRLLTDTGYHGYLPIVLAGDVSAETAQTILDGAYPGVQISTNYVREYPEGALAAHVIGYLGRISQDEEERYVEELGYRKDALVGKDGVEKICEEQLRGVDAVSSLQIDSAGRVKKLLGKSAAVKGEDVTLTLDLFLQKETEDALEKGIRQASLGGTFASDYGDYAMTYARKAAVGAAVALDVETGEVLAMASYPDFDPGDFAASISEEKWQSLQQENPRDPLSPSPLYNVATMSAVQPGSTFKPVTALAALSSGLDRNQRLYDDGAVTLGDRTYGCLLWNEEKKVHGYLDLADAIKVSCNYYFYDIAAGMDFASDRPLAYKKNMNNKTLLHYARQVGLGEKTGIEIGESAGVLPTEQLKKEGTAAALGNFLLAEQETYFTKEALKDPAEIRAKIEKIVNWAEKDLTLEKIVGKLKRDRSIRSNKAYELANICKYTYFNQMGWTRGDTFNMAIGQGDHAYTTLQMANYMAVLARGGEKKKVRLLADGEKDGAAGPSQTAQRADTTLKQEDVKDLIRAMEGVTGEPEGSLYGAFSSFPYRVAAKTGTAQRAGKISTLDEGEYLRRHLHLIAPGVSFSRVEAEADRLMKSYPDLYQELDQALRRAVINLSSRKITTDDIDRYKESYDSFAWTVALAPADDPKIAVAVMLVQGKTSANAAPIVREIIGKYGEYAEWEKTF